MNADELRAIRERAEKATELPGGEPTEADIEALAAPYEDGTLQNVEFIAHARHDVLRLTGTIAEYDSRFDEETAAINKIFGQPLATEEVLAEVERLRRCESDIAHSLKWRVETLEKALREAKINARCHIPPSHECGWCEHNRKIDEALA